MGSMGLTSMAVDPRLLEQGMVELFEHAPCGFLVTLADGTIVQVNETFVAMTGFAREWLLAGKRFAELLTVAGMVYHDTHVAPLLQMRSFVKEVALNLLRHDGHPLPVLMNATCRPLTAVTSGDSPALTLITIFDATDRRTYERELLLAKRRAEEATEAERVARAIAEQAARAKDEFLATVSHELRTPLNAIIGWAQILQSDGVLNDDQREALSVIERNAQVQAELINDLLDMSRIVAGKLRLDVRQVVLGDVIDAAIDTARPAADAKGIRLQKVLSSAVVVAGDPARLQQVFWNLLTNAIKFTPKAGSVRVVMQQVNSHVEVTVVDSGVGMSPSFVAHAFDRFRQSDSSATQKTSGLGLGLSIVKNLVEMHGGSISAASEGEGRGSTFLVTLPLSAVNGSGSSVAGVGVGGRIHPRSEAPPISHGPAEVRGIALNGVRVLVVDDEADARDVVRRLLAGAGAQVLTAASAAEALALLEDQHADVLVSDIGMPGEDGYELIRKVRMMGGGIGSIRAVALTAFARLDDRTRAMLAGYQMHLAKPVDARELIVTVSTLARKT
jgi:PAS domain S-box-containing protein